MNQKLRKRPKGQKPIPVHTAPEFINELIPGRIYRDKSDVFIALYDGVCLVLSNQDVEELTRNGTLRPGVMPGRTIN